MLIAELEQFNPLWTLVITVISASLGTGLAAMFTWVGRVSAKVSEHGESIAVLKRETDMTSRAQSKLEAAVMERFERFEAKLDAIWAEIRKE